MNLPWSTHEADTRARDAAAERERRLLIAYPFPVLDGDAVALLRLPKHLSSADASRIKSAIDSLVTEERDDVKLASVEEHLNRVGQAVRTIAWWLVDAQSGFGRQDAEAIDLILKPKEES